MASPSNILIVGRGPRPSMEETVAHFEPVFCESDADLLPLLPNYSIARRYLAFLDRRLEQYPTDLLAHTRRILVCLALKDRDACNRAWNALHDILGDKGGALKTRLSGLIWKAFSAADARAIEQRNFNVISKILTSRTLHGRYIGEVTIITRLQGMAVRAAAPEESVDAVTEAQQYLEDGQVDRACEILKTALLTAPDDVVVSNELLALYIRGGEQVAIQTILQHFAGRAFALSEQWQKALAEMSTE